MKRFNDLTDEEKAKATTYARQVLVDNLVEGVMIFDEDSIQGKYVNTIVQKAIEKSAADLSGGDLNIARRVLMEELYEELTPYAEAATENMIFIDDEYPVYMDQLI